MKTMIVIPSSAILGLVVFTETAKTQVKETVLIEVKFVIIVPRFDIVISVITEVMKQFFLLTYATYCIFCIPCIPSNVLMEDERQEGDKLHSTPVVRNLAYAGVECIFSCGDCIIDLKKKSLHKETVFSREVSNKKKPRL